MDVGRRIRERKRPRELWKKIAMFSGNLDLGMTSKKLSDVLGMSLIEPEVDIFIWIGKRIDMSA